MPAPLRLVSALAAAAALVLPVLIAPPAVASATANEIVYLTDAGGDGNVAVVRRDLTTGRTTTVFAADGTTFYDEPRLSPDGARMALGTDRGSPELVTRVAVASRTGTGFKAVTAPPQSGTSFASDSSPRWSPDGSTLLFSRTTFGFGGTGPVVTGQLLTVPANGGTATALPATSVEDGLVFGDWSPGGDEIVFGSVAFETGATGPLRRTSPASPTTFTEVGVSGVLPAWSPDGRTIAYSTTTVAATAGGDLSDGVTQLATVSATGPATARVFATSRPTRAPSDAVYASWAPDSQSLTYTLFTAVGSDVWAVDAEGTRAGKVVASPGDDYAGHLQGPPPSLVSPGTPSSFTAVEPGRVLDTRDGTGTGGVVRKVGGATEAAKVLDLQVTGIPVSGGAAGTVPAEATAVVLNVTALNATSLTDVRAYPADAPAPLATNVVLTPRSTVANLVTVPLGQTGAAAGKVRLRNQAGTVDLVADIAGYYVAGPAAARFTAVTPTRLLDTRLPAGAPPVGSAGSRDVKVTGDFAPSAGPAFTVPDTATAVVVNVTAVSATNLTAIRAYPAPTDGGFPEVSNVNVRAGVTTPNLVTVKVGAGGLVRLRNDLGSVHLTMDIAGYYEPTAGDLFTPVTPVRFLDTRVGTGTAAIPLTQGGFLDLAIARARGVSPAASSALLNLTAVNASTTTFVAGYPRPEAGGAVPNVSNLNTTVRRTVANLSVLPVGSAGKVRLYNARGSVNLVGDLAGYFAPAVP